MDSGIVVLCVTASAFACLFLYGCLMMLYHRHERRRGERVVVVCCDVEARVEVVVHPDGGVCLAFSKST